MLTSPDSLRAPDLVDTFNYVTHLQQLANDVQVALSRRSRRIASGRVSITPVANVVSSATVTFPAGRFTSTPDVSLGVASSAQNMLQGGGVGYSGTTTSGVTINLFRPTTTSTTVSWIAMQS